jgi:putative NIF3 family GTP cyclohydrolase 1 type 2
VAIIDERGVHTPLDEAERLGVRAGLAALDGQTAVAIRLYGDAQRAFHELGMVFAGAQTAIEMATVLDPTIPEVAQALESARAVLTRLRARAYLEQLEAASQRTSSSSSEPQRAQSRDTASV